MKICNNYKECPHKDCPFCKPHEERLDDGPADCMGKEVQTIEIDE
jgi:hypothetical protein